MTISAASQTKMFLFSIAHTSKRKNASVEAFFIFHSAND